MPKDFFSESYKQLEIAIIKISYMLHLDELDGNDTAILIQPMVYGNYGEDSASGMFFTRNIVIGKKEIQGSFYHQLSLKRLYRSASLIIAILCSVAVIYIIFTTNPGKDKDASLSFFLVGFFLLTFGIYQHKATIMKVEKDRGIIGEEEVKSNNLLHAIAEAIGRAGGWWEE